MRQLTERTAQMSLNPQRPSLGPPPGFNYWSPRHPPPPSVANLAHAHRMTYIHYESVPVTPPPGARAITAHGRYQPMTYATPPPPVPLYRPEMDVAAGRSPPSSNGSPSPGRECKFCKNNGEAPETYKSHILRNPATGRLICPILRAHVCENCGDTGDDAHTRNYCPLLKSKLREALPLHLKRTRRQSDGSYRS